MALPVFGTMGDLNAAALPENLTLDVLQTLLTHAPGFLNTRELGRLSLCSNTLCRISDDTGVWKGLFDKAVVAGEICVSDGCTRIKTTWSGEPGLLACFAHPSPQILEKVGYKHAAGCLLSKNCFHCCKMAGTANPLTMTRICKDCARKKEASWTITRGKAKEAFLLTDKDCKPFANASFPYGISTTSGTSVLFLLKDVVAASFAKWGGPDGLESEITKRKGAAASRYARRQSSAKPQKKRPKIERLSSRPFNMLFLLRSGVGCALPVPMSFLQDSELKMTHCTKCSLCAVRGTTKDIIMHERLKHGVFDLDLELGEEMTPTPTEVLGIIPETVQPSEELVQLLEQAEVKYEASHFELGDGFAGGDTFCLFTIGDSKVSVDRSEAGGEYSYAGRVVICYQTGENMLPVPVELAYIGFGENGVVTEADEVFFGKLKEALNLRETTSSQLLATLICRAIPNFESYEIHEWVEPDEHEVPVIYHAWELLEFDRYDDDFFDY